jgi:hypothetical protein
MKMKQICIVVASAGLALMFIASWERSSACMEVPQVSSAWDILGGDGDCQEVDTNSLKASGCTACVGSGSSWRKCDGPDPGNQYTSCKNSTNDCSHCSCTLPTCPGDEILFSTQFKCQIDDGGSNQGACARQ